MKSVRKIAMVLVFALIFAAIFSSVRPYWKKYWLTIDMESVAVYGTKHTIGDTKKRLNKVMEEKGYGFDSRDFRIKKNQDKDTTIQIKYDDQIGLFGFVIKELKFDVKVTERHVKAVL